MGVYAVISLINAIVSSILGPFVYFKNRKQILNKLFAFFCLTIAIWSYSYFFWQISTTQEVALFWCRALMTGAIFISVVYCHFILALIKKIKEYKKYLIFGYLIFICFFLVNFTSLFVKSVTPKLNFLFWPNPGILYHPFLLFWLFYAFFSIYLLIKELSIITGVFRTQIKYILIGTIIGYLGGITNYFLWYDIPILPVGNWSTTFYLAIVAYAIVRYRLMDIHLVLGRGAIYLFSFTTVIALVFVLMFLNNQLAQPLSFNIVGPLIIILSILSFQFLFRFFEKLASKYFYYTFYSYQRVLTDLGKRLIQFLDLDTLTSLITNTLINTMKLDKTVILLRESETGNYQIKKNIGFREENGISLSKDNFLTLYLEKTQKPIVAEELSLIIRDIKDKKEKEKLENLQSNLKKIEAALCLPLFIEEKIIGMIVLGNKLSGQSYSVQDIELLTVLSNQASIAFQNAKLYSEVKGFSQKLEKEVQKATKELREAYEKLKKLDKAKTEFISIASHQLRTPLAVVKGYISMILEKSYGELPKEIERPLKNISISNERLIKLVNDLLSVTRIETGKIKMSIEKSSIEEIINSVIEELKNEAEEKGIYLKFEKPEKTLPKIPIDQDKIRQVILNIVDNAIKYTEKGGITIKLQVTNAKLQMSVRDTGAGLSKYELSKIFESFSRGAAGTTFYAEGVGLGLYVARKFVEMHNGKIWAESKGKGKGSDFYIELPIK